MFISILLIDLSYKSKRRVIRIKHKVNLGDESIWHPETLNPGSASVDTTQMLKTLILQLIFD